MGRKTGTGLEFIGISGAQVISSVYDPPEPFLSKTPVAIIISSMLLLEEKKKLYIS